MKKEWYNSKKSAAGFSTVEAMLSVAVFAMVATAFTSGLVYGPQGSVDAGKRSQANALIQQAFSAIDSIRSDAWNTMTNTQSAVDVTTGAWAFTGEGTTETIGDFTRTVTFADVCRTSGNAITACPGVYTDPNTKQATVRIEWTNRFGVGRSTSSSRYFVNWESSQWEQTDWSGGDGQATLLDETQYDSDDSGVDGATTAGQLTLAAYVPCTDKSYPFDTATDYTYDNSLIEVTGGQAQLVSAGSAPDSNTKGLWHLDEASGTLVDASGNGNTLTVTGSPTYNSTGTFGTALSYGSSTQYHSITDAAQTGLDITGSITVEAWVKKTAMSGSDTILDKWTSGADRSFQFFIGNLGRPTFELRNGAATALATAPAGTMVTGTWYHVAGVYDGSAIKVYVNGTLVGSTAYAGGIQNGAAPFEISKTSTAALNGTIDEVRVSDTARYTGNFTVPTYPFGVYYSSAQPTIQPVESYDPTTVSAWLGFQETSTLAVNTSLQYQLSSDDGATWQYWTGSVWAAATTATQYNTAATINTNIPTFTAATGKILWRAFLVSDGSDQVQLDTVVARCEIDQSYSFDTATDYTYDNSLIEVTGGQAQLVSAGSAPDSNTKGLWHLDEASGTLVDASGNSNTLTATGSPTYNSTGTFGTAVSYGNTTQYHAITDAAQTGLDITGSITVEAWISKTAMSGSDTIVHKWSSGPDRSYQMYIANNGRLWFQLINGTTTASGASAVGAITTGTWYHVAGVYDGSTIKVFINGVQAGSTAYSAGINNGAAPFEISKNSTEAFNGIIDEVRVSNTARYTTNFTVPAHPFGVYYSQTQPTVQPVSGLTARSVGAWIGVTESATLTANTSVQYQLSSDGGSTWQYWNGSAWAAATASTDYNTAATVHANVGSFATAPAQLLFKAFLVSDGSNQVQLDSFVVRYQEAADSGYLSSGELTSSAFDMGKASAVQVVAWNDDVTSCEPDCAIQVELRTAPDNGGVPDTASWTDWYGEDGASTVFTNHYGTLVSTDLNGNQWVQYRVTLTGNDVDTPVLEDITVNYH